MAAGCAENPHVGSNDYAVSVEAAVDAGSCSTASVIGLSVQILQEIQCMAPGLLDTLEEGNGIEFAGSAVLPYVAADGKADLLAAVAEHGGTLRINSGFRSVVQQYLLYRWWQAGLCGIPAAATPGRSNHESARALDIGNYSDWKSTLEAHGWYEDVPGDPVHFDHTASGDIRGMDVHAFQRLWNRNHPDDRIDEDGVYGPQTGARLSMAPTDGFAIGACDPPTDPTDPGTTDPTDPTDPGTTDPNAPDSPADQWDGSGSRSPDDLAGGCAAGGSGSAPALMLVLIGGLAVTRRRRTSRGARRRR